MNILTNSRVGNAHQSDSRLGKTHQTEYLYVQLRQSVKVALPLSHTTEVISVTRDAIALIPGVAPALLGVVNQRGRLLWVVELSNLLRLEPSPTLARPQDRLTLLVLKANSESAVKAESHFGCVVSKLEGIVPLNPKQFKPVPKRLSSKIRHFVSGVTEIEQSPVAILNIEAILAALQSTLL